MIPSLVVLTDFFDVSNHALSYAAGLAVPLDAHLVLLHVRHDALLAPGSTATAGTPRAASGEPLKSSSNWPPISRCPPKWTFRKNFCPEP